MKRLPTNMERACITAAAVHRFGLMSGVGVVGSSYTEVRHAGPFGIAAPDDLVDPSRWRCWFTYAGARYLDGVVVPTEADAVLFVATGKLPDDAVRG